MYITPFSRGDSFVLTIPPFVDTQGRNLFGPTWTCKISFRNNGNQLDKTADANWNFNFSSSETLLLKSGLAFYQIIATYGSEQVTVDRGQVEIKENLVLQDQTYDARSQTRKDLEAVQNLIRQIIITGGAIEYRIGLRQLKKYELSELRQLESQLKYRLNFEERQEKIKNGLGDPFSKYVRFS